MQRGRNHKIRKRGERNPKKATKSTWSETKEKKERKDRRERKRYKGTSNFEHYESELVNPLICPVRSSAAAQSHSCSLRSLHSGQESDSMEACRIHVQEHIPCQTQIFKHGDGVYIPK